MSIKQSRLDKEMAESLRNIRQGCESITGELREHAAHLWEISMRMNFQVFFYGPPEKADPNFDATIAREVGSAGFQRLENATHAARTHVQIQPGNTAHIFSVQRTLLEVLE